MSVPSNWPEDVKYVTKNVYSKQLKPEILKQIGYKARGQQKVSKLVKIKKIVIPSHPAFGQYGLFAAVNLQPNSHIVDYLGYVHPFSESDETSDYDLCLDRSLEVAVDGKSWGTEARMVNDYRGIKERPNAEFRDRVVDDEMRIAVYVSSKPVKKGEEICVSYGKGFWGARDNDQV